MICRYQPSYIFFNDPKSWNFLIEFPCFSVPISMETEASDNVDKDLSDLQRKDGGGRHRKKQLYQQIMNLMEFYLSDSNLRKDRFFSQLLQESPGKKKNSPSLFHLCLIQLNNKAIRKISLYFK